MTYIYGLIDTVQPPGAAVLDQLPQALGPVHARRSDRWTLIYSEHPGDDILPKRRLMLAHTKVLEALMPLGTLLPARFGLLADTDAAIDALIRKRRNDIAATFDRVRDCVELGVRIRFDRDAALQAALAASADLQTRRHALVGRGPEAHFDRAEFGRILAERLDRRRQAAQRQLLVDLRAHSVSHVLQAPEDDIEVLRAEFLIREDYQTAFVEAVASAAAKTSFAPGVEPAIQIVGPVPMYNFVNLSLSLDPADEAA